LNLVRCNKNDVISDIILEERLLWLYTAIGLMPTARTTKWIQTGESGQLYNNHHFLWV